MTLANDADHLSTHCPVLVSSMMNDGGQLVTSVTAAAAALRHLAGVVAGVTK